MPFLRLHALHILIEFVIENYQMLSMEALGRNFINSIKQGKTPVGNISMLILLEKI